jgi:hypothetical protein
MAVVALLKHIWKWANNNQGGLTLLLFAIGGLFSLIVLGWKQYRLKYPFVLREAYEDYDYYKTGKKRTLSWLFEPIRIFCINNDLLNKDKINLYIEAKRKVKLSYINLRFVDKKPFMHATDISASILAIEKIAYPQEKYLFKITCNDDKKGGKDCYFNPPTEISKGNILFLEIYPKINLSQKLKCKISLDNSSGEEKRTKSRKEVIITNELI